MDILSVTAVFVPKDHAEAGFGVKPSALTVYPNGISHRAGIPGRWLLLSYTSPRGGGKVWRLPLSLLARVHDALLCACTIAVIATGLMGT